MKILITGGSGSLGRALVAILKEEGRHTIAVYSRNEAKLAKYFGREPSVKCFIGDVRDYKRLNSVMKMFQPTHVIHAAALKRIDDMEIHPTECIATNVEGSKNVANAAIENGVQRCVLVSTDKACLPVNTYGASKFLAERLFTNFDYSYSSTRLASIRYGNVIASRGSFIPMWMNAIKNGEMIGVTSLECSRFLFTLHDAAKAVISALHYMSGGEVFVPKLKSYRMTSVLEALKKCLDVKDISYDVIGLRPGEKIHEDMLSELELERTFEVNGKLLAILPQYSNRAHFGTIPYKGALLNSDLCASKDNEELAKLIIRGVEESK